MTMIRASLLVPGLLILLATPPVALAQNIDFTSCVNDPDGNPVADAKVVVWSPDGDAPLVSGTTASDGCVSFYAVNTASEDEGSIIDGLSVKLDGPNPVSEYTRFEISGDADRVEFYDVLGRRLAEVDMLGFNRKAEVDLNIADGIYFVRAVNKAGESSNASFVKVGGSVTRVELDEKTIDFVNEISASKSASGSTLEFLVSHPDYLDVAEAKWVVNGGKLDVEVVHAPTARVRVIQAENHDRVLSDVNLEIWTPFSNQIVTPDSAGFFNFVIPARTAIVNVLNDSVKYLIKVSRHADHNKTHYGTVLGGSFNQSDIPLMIYFPDSVAVGKDTFTLFGPDDMPLVDTVNSEFFVFADTTWYDYVNYVGFDNNVQFFTTVSSNSPFSNLINNHQILFNLPHLFKNITFDRDVVVGFALGDSLVTNHTIALANRWASDPDGLARLYANTRHNVSYKWFSSLDVAVDSSNFPLKIVSDVINAPGFNGQAGKWIDGDFAYAVVFTPREGYLQMNYRNTVSEYAQGKFGFDDVAQGLYIFFNVSDPDSVKYSKHASELVAVKQAIGSWPGLVGLQGGIWRGERVRPSPNTPFFNKKAFPPFYAQLVEVDIRNNSVVAYRLDGSSAPEDLRRRYFEVLGGGGPYYVVQYNP